MKETWKVINQVLNKRSKYSNIDSLKGSCSDMIHKKDISNTMNKFFCSNCKDHVDDIAPAPNSLLSGDYEINANKVKFHLRTIEVQEIRDAFAKAKASKNSGTDNIVCYFLKLALPFIESLLLVCLIHLLKQVSFLTYGKYQELPQFLKMVIRLIKVTIDLYPSCQTSQGSSKN